jgi:hypothetical protein
LSERLVSLKASEPQHSSTERRTQLGATVATAESAADRREAESRPVGEPRSGKERNISPSKPAEELGNRRTGKRRRTSKDNELAGTIRYFLTKATSNGTPELDQEMPDEHQALVAALKADRTFVTVEEWRAKADKRKGITVIGKDPVLKQ